MCLLLILRTRADRWEPLFFFPCSPQMPEFVCLLFMCKGLCSLTMEAHTGGAWGPVGWVFRHQVQRALRLVTDGLDFVLKGTGSCCKLFRWEWLDRTRVCDMCGSWMVRRWGGGQVALSAGGTWEAKKYQEFCDGPGRDGVSLKEGEASGNKQN